MANKLQSKPWDEMTHAEREEVVALWKAQSKAQKTKAVREARKDLVKAHKEEYDQLVAKYMEG